MGIGKTTLRKKLSEVSTPDDVIKEEEEPVENTERKYKSVKQSAMEFAALKRATEEETYSNGVATLPTSVGRQVTKVINNKKLQEEAQIAEYRRQMNFPAEVSRTVARVEGGGGGSGSNSASLNSGSSYNRNSKRGARLVRSR